MTQLAFQVCCWELCSNTLLSDQISFLQVTPSFRFKHSSFCSELFCIENIFSFPTSYFPHRERKYERTGVLGLLSKENQVRALSPPPGPH